jgi:hypothetical protein
MNGNPTAIKRNWSKTIGYLIGGLAALGLSGVLFVTLVEGPITFGIALVVAIVAIVLLYGAKGGAGEAACPSCGAVLTALSTGKNDGVLCAQCLAYTEGQGGKLWVTDLRRVADRALFGAQLPAQFTWPQGCCVCGVPPTRREAISTAIQRTSSALGVIAVAGATGGAVTGRAGTTRFTVEVPHCDAHKDGAELSAMGDGHVKVVFKSYPYLRAFCQQNNLRPV